MARTRSSQATPTTRDAIDQRLDATREAADRRAWREAYEPLVEIDGDGRLDAAGLELLGSVAWWAGDPDRSIGARERAVPAYLKDGDTVRAAYVACLLAMDHRQRSSEAAAGGWRACAARILQGEPEGVAHGYLAMVEGDETLVDGDGERAFALAERAVDLGARYGDRDLQGYGRVAQGMAVVRAGDPEQGLALLDEAAAAAGRPPASWSSAIAGCAVAIQRRLAEHRREHGFAPQVRIGVHTANVAKLGHEFSGIGVNQAARIAALADGGQILASRETAGDRRATGDPRTVSLKGIAEPVEIVSVGWR